MQNTSRINTRVAAQALNKIKEIFFYFLKQNKKEKRSLEVFKMGERDFRSEMCVALQGETKSK